MNNLAPGHAGHFKELAAVATDRSVSSITRQGAEVIEIEAFLIAVVLPCLCATCL
jgi:hypothetical protein